MSCPSIRMRPESIFIPGRANPSKLSATEVLPEPDSPISASTLPSSTENETFLTSSLPAKSLILRESTTSVESSAIVIPLGTPDRARKAVCENVDRHRKGGDGEGGSEGKPGSDRDANAVLTDHEAPIRRRRRKSQPQIAQGRVKDNRTAEPDAEVRQNRGQNVGQDVAQADCPPALSPRERGFDIFECGDVERDETRY